MFRRADVVFTFPLREWSRTPIGGLNRSLEVCWCSDERKMMRGVPSADRELSLTFTHDVGVRLRALSLSYR